MILEKQKGQILLIVVLVVIVTLTVGLSLATRSVVNLGASTEEAQSQKALSAAEAGIERALKSDEAGSGIIGDVEYITTITLSGGEEDDDKGKDMVLNGGNPVSKNEGINIWFQEHNPDNGELIEDGFRGYDNVRLYWGDPAEECGGDNPPAAIEVIVFTVPTGYSYDSGTEKIYRYAYDACASDNGNNFTQEKVGTAGYDVGVPPDEVVTLHYKTPEDDGLRVAGDINPSAGENIVFMRVIPIYKDTIIGIKNSSALPSQGYAIDSTGTSGEASRRIKVFKGWPQLYLPYVAYGLYVAADE